MAPVAAALDDEQRQALSADVTEAMRPWTDDDGVAFPREAYIVVARP